MQKKQKTEHPDGSVSFSVKSGNNLWHGISTPAYLEYPVKYPNVVYVALSETGMKGGALWTLDELDSVSYKPEKTIPVPTWLVEDVKRKYKIHNKRLGDKNGRNERV
ncbi:hypothetical protein [Pectobacterium versatile]|uniref:hypothetical protein n=1 Tax=Pectobacterium versatile TaxID=2488639 RepID=UPI0011AF3AB7|nr:hypothetical protein [Pectobacterium versatile]